MINLTPEMLLKAKECKTAEEIVTLAKENNIEITQDQATEYYAQINQTGELSDNELDNVAGGGCGGDNENSAPKQTESTLVKHDTPCKVCKNADCLFHIKMFSDSFVEIQCIHCTAIIRTNGNYLTTTYMN